MLSLVFLLFTAGCYAERGYAVSVMPQFGALLTNDPDPDPNATVCRLSVRLSVCNV